MEYIALTRHDERHGHHRHHRDRRVLRARDRLPHPGQLSLRRHDFNVTRAGIHADGLLKNEEIYNIFDTTKVLNRPPRVLVDKTSGTAGVAWWLNSYFHLPPAKRIDKKSDAVRKIVEWIDHAYDDGRTTSISDEEMLGQVKKHLPGLLTGPRAA